MILLALSGCAATAVQTARTNGAGKFQAGVEVAGGRSAVTILEEADIPLDTTIPVVGFNAAFRLGVHDNVDLGIRLGTTLYEIQLKGMFTEPDSPVIVSLAPAFSYMPVGEFFRWGNVPVPVLIGIPLGDGHEAVFAPRLRYNFSVIEIQNQEVLRTSAVSGGLSAGFAWRIGGAFTLLPELGVDFPITDNIEVLGGLASFSGIGGTTTTFTVGFLFGGYDRPSLSSGQQGGGVPLP